MLLLHICCANCASVVYNQVSISFSGFWYNPNIHPYSEYQKRLMAGGYFMQKIGRQIIYKDEYNLKEFLQEIMEDPSLPRRCHHCYRMRLKETAKKAKELNFTSFSSTLLASAQQQHEVIKEIGGQIAEECKIKFYYEDWRKNWKAGMEISRKYHLYRQKYCGCIFSEEERYPDLEK